MGMYGWHDNILNAQQVSFTNAKPGVIAGPVLLAGNSTQRVISSLPNTKFLQFYFDSTATSGDNRGMYLRTYFSGAGGGGEALRAFTTINGVACGTAHGAHISLSFVSSANSGRLTGLGVAMRGTLHIPSDGDWTSGTLAALQAEIWSDGAASDPDGLTELSFIRVVNGGDASGVSDVDDDANLLVITGGSIASGNMVQTEVTETKFSHKIRCKVHGTIMYLMACDS